MRRRNETYGPLLDDDGDTQRNGPEVEVRRYVRLEQPASQMARETMVWSTQETHKEIVSMSAGQELAVSSSQATYSLSPAEYALLEGDLSKLSEPQRLALYNNVCSSLGLNPMTAPFGYIRLNNKLTLYAKKDCTDQLRKIHGVSITELHGVHEAGVYIVTVKAQDATGRSDAATAAVPIENLKGDALCNCLMKAETKAKRRVTLSICGLGMLDASETDTIPYARLEPAHVNTPVGTVDRNTGEVIQETAAPAPPPLTEEEKAELQADAVATKNAVVAKAKAMGYGGSGRILCQSLTGKETPRAADIKSAWKDDKIDWNAVCALADERWKMAQEVERDEAEVG